MTMTYHPGCRCPECIKSVRYTDNPRMFTQVRESPYTDDNRTNKVLRDVVDTARDEAGLLPSRVQRDQANKALTAFVEAMRSTARVLDDSGGRDVNEDDVLEIISEATGG